MRAQGRGRWAAVAVFCCMLLCLSSTSIATSVETLLMPGKVTQAHVKEEEKCANCHDRSNTHTQSSLCLECHKDIAADITARLKFHGRMTNAGLGECRACHTEHKGRDADIVQLDRNGFDHHLTDFPLQGAHLNVSCVSCHEKNEAWRKAPADCAGCHKSDDVHKGQLTPSCGDCHSSDTWAGGKYDHDKTSFKLTGAHDHVACNACHIGGHYEGTPKSCVGCHATDDEHRGARGTDCAKCHVTQTWKTAKYDHLKETGYALEGVHDRITCAACHRSGNYKDPIPKDCNGCHRADDAHATRFGAKCSDCHDKETWPLTTYDHAAKHDFALVGAHAKLDCYSCHSAAIANQKLPRDCAGCHRSEDPHGAKFKVACDSCHGENGWRADLVFDHDLTSFPLLGLHRVVSCAQCHDTLAYTSSPTTCIGCHAHEDVHKGGLGQKCESCHSANGWRLWQFDHAKETRFPLLGAHAKIQCADCHKVPPGTAKTSAACASCHTKDDRHLGQFGERCDQCHTVETWKGARIQ